MNSGA
jgi:hypothetical protein